MTGYRDGPPIVPRGPGDPLGGMHAAFALMVALAERDATGEGVLVEMPLVEAALNLAAEQVLEHSAYGNLLERAGNRSPGVAPQGVYRCSGVEQWLAVSVTDDEQWRGLRRALGDPSWARDPALHTLAGRQVAHDDLDRELAAWARDRDVGEAVAALLAHGVPAAAVADPRSIHRHEQLAGRSFFEPCEHPLVGRHLIPTLPFRFASVERWIETPAPTLGQHNREVLTELGLDDAEIDRLEADGVIGTRPVGL